MKVLYCGLRVHFFLLIYCITAITEIFSSAPIVIQGKGAQKSRSITAGYAQLQTRSLSDPIAKEVFKGMQAENSQQKENVINEYNRRLELEKIKLDLEKIKTDNPTAFSAVESAASSRGISLSSLIRSPGGGGAGGSSGNITPGPDETAFEEIRRNHADALEKLRSSEQKIQDLERQLGSSAVTAILASMPATSSSDIVPINHLQQSYIHMIQDISALASTGNGSAVQNDYDELGQLLSSIEIAIPENHADGHLTEEKRDELLAITRSGFDIVSRYQELKFEAFENKIREATSLRKLKDVVLTDIFYQVFFEKMSEIKIRIVNLDVLEQSLDCTALYLDFAKALIGLNIYSPEKVVTGLTQILNQNEVMLNAKIKVRDAEIYREYLPSLESTATFINSKYFAYAEQKSRGSISKENDFAFVPVPLQLMRTPLALFALLKTTFTDKEFNDIQIIDQSLKYLTKEQTKAFFAYLYRINEDFSEISKAYVDMTLGSTPIQQIDVKNLMQLVKKRIKVLVKEEAENPNFSPAFKDKSRLREFSESIDDLANGTIKIKILKRKLKSAQEAFNTRLSSVTMQGLLETKRNVDAMRDDISNQRSAMLAGTIESIEKFNRTVTAKGGIDSVDQSQEQELLELLETMQQTQKNIEDKASFPIRDLIANSNATYSTGETLLNSTAAPSAAGSSLAAAIPPIGGGGHSSAALSSAAGSSLVAAIHSVGGGGGSSSVSAFVRPAPPRRKVAGGGPAKTAPVLASASPQEYENDLNELERKANEKSTAGTITASDLAGYMTRIEAARANIAEPNLAAAGMKIRSLKRDLK